MSRQITVIPAKNNQPDKSNVVHQPLTESYSMKIAKTIFFTLPDRTSKITDLLLIVKKLKLVFNRL